MAALLATVLSACTQLGLHRDVDAFISEREMCDHLRGEITDTPDSESAQEIANSLNESCAGTDEELRRLKVRYGHDNEIMKVLNAFETGIESTKK